MPLSAVCLKHGYAVHTKYELAAPYPLLFPKTHLRMDGVAVMNTGDSLIALSVELETDDSVDSGLMSHTQAVDNEHMQLGDDAQTFSQASASNSASDEFTKPESCDFSENFSPPPPILSGASGAGAASFAGGGGFHDVGMTTSSQDDKGSVYDFCEHDQNFPPLKLHSRAFMDASRKNSNHANHHKDAPGPVADDDKTFEKPPDFFLHSPPPLQLVCGGDSNGLHLRDWNSKENKFTKHDTRLTSAGDVRLPILEVLSPCVIKIDDGTCSTASSCYSSPVIYQNDSQCFTYSIRKYAEMECPNDGEYEGWYLVVVIVRR